MTWLFIENTESYFTYLMPNTVVIVDFENSKYRYHFRLSPPPSDSEKGVVLYLNKFKFTSYMEIALNQDWLKFVQWIWRKRLPTIFKVCSLFRYYIREGHCKSFEQTWIPLTKIILIKLANRFGYDVKNS